MNRQSSYSFEILEAPINFIRVFGGGVGVVGLFLIVGWVVG